MGPSCFPCQCEPAYINPSERPKHGEDMKSTEQEKKLMELPSNPQEIVSEDDEIDYSIKPEFYDPDMDDKDEQWVLKKTKGHSSDAVLSCPACFTTLCLDCQRHEKYVTQYRAMFVVNCKIKNDQILRQRELKRKKGNSSIGSKAMFKRVCCSVCSTEVGVFDEYEVYHFFNVLPSES